MQNIFNKLAKVNGSNRKVNLTGIDDLRAELERLQDHASTASYYADERWGEIQDKIYEFQREIGIEVDNQVVNGEVNYPEEFFRDLKEIMMPIEFTADALGIDPSELSGDFAEAMNFMESYKETYEDYRKGYKEVVELAGFLQDFM